MHPVEFDYKTYQHQLCPIVKVGLGGLLVDAYVDTGAFISVFSRVEIEGLELKVSAGRPGNLIVGDGRIMPVTFHRLPVSIGDFCFPATVAFSSQLKIGFNLLGRRDIFTRFIVTFDDVRGIVSFRPRQRV